jgi:hypothetical protein
MYSITILQPIAQKGTDRGGNEDLHPLRHSGRLLDGDVDLRGYLFC